MKKTIFHFQLIIAALIIALGGTFSCSKGGKQPVEKQAVAPIDTTISLRTDSVNPEWNNKLDSLLCVAATASQDTNLAKVYHQIAKMYLYNDQQKANVFYLKLKALSEKLDWNEGRQRFFTGTVSMLITKGLMDSAIIVNNQALELANKENNEKWVARILANTGVCYANKEWYETALNYYYQALPIFEKIGDSLVVAQVYLLMDKAYYSLQMMDESFKYAEKAVNMYNNYPDDSRRADALVNYAASLEEKREFEKEEKCLLEAKRISEIHNNRKVLRSVYQNLASIAIHKYDLSKYETYLHKVLEYGIGLDEVEKFCLLNRNFAYLEQYKGNFDRSEKYIKMALDTALVYELTDEQMQCYYHLADLATTRHDFRNYRIFGYKGDSIRNTMNTKQSIRSAAEMAAKYETEKKELEIENQKHIIDRQNMQRGLLAGGVAVSIAILVLLWYMLRLRNRRNSALTERNDALAEMNATKDKFFSIISHDLKNPALAQRDALQLLINNARSWNIDTLTDYYHELLKSADGQVELLYNLLNWAQVQTGRMAYTPATFTLSDLLSDTALIRNMANSKGITLILPESQNALITGDRNMLSTVIRNLLTNAIKFTPAGGTVTLDISPNSGDTSTVHRVPCTLYRISVTDTGVGMNVETGRALSLRALSLQSRRGTAGEQGSGLGLIVCKELLEKHSSELHVESEEGKGSKFWFTISSSI